MQKQHFPWTNHNRSYQETISWTVACHQGIRAGWGLALHTLTLRVINDRLRQDCLLALEGSPLGKTAASAPSQHSALAQKTAPLPASPDLQRNLPETLRRCFLHPLGTQASYMCCPFLRAWESRFCRVSEDQEQGLKTPFPQKNSNEEADLHLPLESGTGQRNSAKMLTTEVMRRQGSHHHFWVFPQQDWQGRGQQGLWSQGSPSKCFLHRSFSSAPLNNPCLPEGEPLPHQSLYLKFHLRHTTKTPQFSHLSVRLWAKVFILEPPALNTDQALWCFMSGKTIQPLQQAIIFS